MVVKSREVERLMVACKGSNKHSPMVEALQELLESLREARVDALTEGKTTQAAHLQAAIQRTYDRLTDWQYHHRHD